ncbi:MAG: hypothetical protein JXA74_17245 [Anaerolineae bacterium]|nr:hypothetical protein [Anaerolineae bacterium]
MTIKMKALLRPELQLLADRGYYDPESEMLNPSLLAYLSQLIELLEPLGVDLWHHPSSLEKVGQFWAQDHPGEPLKVPFTWAIG